MRKNRTVFYYKDFDKAIQHYHKLYSAGKKVVLKRPDDTRDTYLVKILEE